MGEIGGADLAGEGSRVDDHPLAPGAEKMANGDLVGQEHAAGIDVEIEVPVLVCQALDRCHGRDAGIGTKNVITAEILLDLLEAASTLARLRTSI